MSKSTARSISIGLALAMGILGVQAPCAAGTSALAPAGDDLLVIARSLADRPVDPLSPFHLSLSVTLEELSRVVSVPETGRLQARDDVYVRASLAGIRGELAGGVLPAPAGLRVLDGDLFFLQGDSSLVQASLLVEATASKEGAISTIEQWLGDADFEIVLPGSLSLVIGWRTPGGYLMGTFSELEIFRLSAFPDAPSDLLAGSQIVLYEGLADYSRGLEGGRSEAELLPDLERIVRWVEATRSVLRPVN